MEIVDDVGSLALFRFARESHLRARHKGRWLREERVEIVVGPIAALGLHPVRVIEPRVRTLRASDDAIERRTDLDRAAFSNEWQVWQISGVGLALATSALASSTAKGISAAAGAGGGAASLAPGRGVAGLQRSIRRIDRVGKHAHAIVPSSVASTARASLLPSVVSIRAPAPVRNRAGGRAMRPPTAPGYAALRATWHTHKRASLAYFGGVFDATSLPCPIRSSSFRRAWLRPACRASRWSTSTASR